MSRLLQQIQITTAKISPNCFDSTHRLSILLVPERFDGIEVRRAVGGVEAEADADGGANDEAGEGPAEGEDDVGLEPVGDEIAEDDAENDAEDAAGFGNEDGFGEKLTEDIAAAGAD